MNAPALTSRREALAVLTSFAATTAMATPTAGAVRASRETSAAVPTRGAEISVQTIAEAEKLHALTFTDVERRQLVEASPEIFRSIEAIRRVPKARSLMPALHFDPRLPGKAYGPQPDRLELVGAVRKSLPADPAAIACASVRDQGHWLRSGQISSRRLTEIYLERIARLGPALQCFITVTADLARSEADRADRELAQGRDCGPLQGIPYGIKDVFDTAGIRSTWGAAPFKERVPNEDAAVVSRLRSAGSVLLGKLATGNIAWGSAWFGGDTRNPWNLEESSGGSSAGPASATAAGLVGYSVGTDSLGSILNPADRCGVTGLRPTFGRVSTRNSMPLTPSLSRIGPLTRTVEDAAIVLAALNGHDPQQVDSIPMGFSYEGGMDLRRLRVGYVPAWFESAPFDPRRPFQTSPPQVRVLDELRALGVQLVEIALPDLPAAALVPAILFTEAAALFEDLTFSGQDDELLAGDAGLGWANPWRQAHLYSAVDYVQADRIRRLLMLEYDRLFERIDVLCGPLYPRSLEPVAATNFTGHPGLTLRVGFTELPTRKINGASPDPTGPRTRVPQNIAMHGALFAEGSLLALARALEEKLDVWGEVPPHG